MFLDFTEPLKEKQTKLQEALIKDIKYQLLWTVSHVSGHMPGEGLVLREGSGDMSKRAVLQPKATFCYFVLFLFILVALASLLIHTIARHWRGSGDGRVCAK